MADMHRVPPASKPRWAARDAARRIGQKTLAALHLRGLKITDGCLET